MNNDLYSILILLFILANILTIICHIGKIAKCITYAFGADGKENATLYQVIILLTLLILMVMILIFLVYKRSIIAYLYSPITEFFNTLNSLFD